MQCNDFREIADSYLSDELLVETNHDVIRHLESCAGCRRELGARRDLRSQLRQGFQQVPQLRMRDEFTAILQGELRKAARHRAHSAVAWRIAYGAVAASLVFAVALGFRAALQRSYLPNPPHVAQGEGPSLNGADEKDADQPGFLNVLLIEGAVGDHQNCAIKYQLEEKPIGLEEAGRTYDPANLDLAKVIMSEGILPAGTELVDAHSCVFKGQRFGHVILRYHGQLVSVLVMKKDATDQRVPQGEPSIVSAQANGYLLAHFQTARHAIFVVSGLSNSENMTIARAIAPSVSRHIQDSERIA